MKRTFQQNKALHLDFTLIANALNDAGLDQRKVLKPSIEIPWTPEAVKEQLWRVIQKSMYHKESTTELDKIGEIEKIHDVLMRHLGEKFHLEYIPFPHDPNKQKSDLLEGMKVDVRKNEDYPEEDIMPRF